MTHKHLLRMIRHVVSARTEITSRDTYWHTPMLVGGMVP